MADIRRTRAKAVGTAATTTGIAPIGMLVEYYCNTKGFTPPAGTITSAVIIIFASLFEGFRNFLKHREAK